MKKIKLISLAFVLVNLLLASCNDCIKGSGDIAKIERSVPSFTQVKIKGDFNLYISQDNTQRVELISDDNLLPFIKTQVIGEVLEIGYSTNECIRKSHRQDIYITIPRLTAIVLDGSGNVKGQNEFTGENMRLDLNGSGNLSLRFVGNSITNKLDGSGKMVVHGNSSLATHIINGSGYINASSLNTKDATAKINGSGNIEVAVSDLLNAAINGSGRIQYLGNPTTDINITGSGSVTKR